jgi:hypothetical protein
MHTFSAGGYNVTDPIVEGNLCAFNWRCKGLFYNTTDGSQIDSQFSSELNSSC